MDTNAQLVQPRRIISPKRKARSTVTPVDLEPATAYEAITRQKVENLEDDLAEIKNRVDTIFYLVIGSILVDMISRWVSG
jgi:hypothetical protein